MSLDVIRPEDVPMGPRLFHKEADRSLTTRDIPLAQPVVAHPSTSSFHPVPWKDLHKPVLEEIPRTRPRQLYPPVPSSRPRDLSLLSTDINGEIKSKVGVNSEGIARRVAVDPLSPYYQFSSSEAPPPLVWRASGRCTLDVSDIEGASPAPLTPFRQWYGHNVTPRPGSRGTAPPSVASTCAQAILAGDATLRLPEAPTPCGTLRGPLLAVDVPEPRAQQPTPR